MNHNGYFHPETDDYRYWTLEEEKQLENLVSTALYSFEKIGSILNRSGSSCQSHSIIMGLTNSYKRRIYDYDKKFWNNYNPITMYWAGFIAADGYIYEKTNTLKIEVQVKDRVILETFALDTKHTGKIFDIIRPDKNSYTVKTSITSPIWIKALREKFGLFQGKTKYIEPPRINNFNLLTKWLQGYTDGDGCIYINSKNNLYIKYVSSSKILIEWIKNYFEDFGFKVIAKPSKIKDYNTYYEFSIGGVKAAQFVLLINSLSGFKLERKWKNPQILSVINSYKRKYPDIFKKFEEKYLNVPNLSVI